MPLRDIIKRLTGIDTRPSNPNIDAAGHAERRQARASLGGLSRAEGQLIDMPDRGRSNTQTRKEAIRRARAANRRNIGRPSP